MDNPTIGRIVHYYTIADQQKDFPTHGPHAAIVVGLRDGDPLMIDIVAFPGGKKWVGIHHETQSKQYDYWTWPPRA